MKSLGNAFAFFVLGAVSVLTPLGTHAQQVYKCGSTYSQTPCAEAKTLTLQDPRSAQQKRRMDKQTEQAGELANRMERDRQKQEQRDRSANQAVILPKVPQTPLPPKKPDAPNSDSDGAAFKAAVVPRAEKPKLSRPRKSDDFTALTPKPPRPLKSTQPSKQAIEN
jgi:hypothetical protein